MFLNILLEYFRFLILTPHLNKIQEKLPLVLVPLLEVFL